MLFGPDASPASQVPSPLDSLLCFHPPLQLCLLCPYTPNSLSLHWPLPDPPHFSLGLLATSQCFSTLPHVLLAHSGKSSSRGHFWLEGWGETDCGASFAACCAQDLQWEAEASWNVVSSVLQGELSGQVSRALLGYSEDKDLPAMQETRDPWVRKIPWRREWLPTPVFLPGESHGQRSLEGHSPRDLEE